MLSLADCPALITVTKDFVADPTPTLVVARINAAGLAFDANGWSVTTATSTVAFVANAGSANQKIVAKMKCVSPTTTANEDFGVIARCQSFESTTHQTYYYARLSAGVAKLTKVVANSFTNLATTAWNPPVNTFVTFTLQCVGNAISAIWHDESGGLSDANLSASDSAVPQNGFMGFRSLTSTMSCSSFTGSELSPG